MADAIRYNRIAHHGAGVLCPPGNTIEAIHLGVDAGADMIEIDVRTTRDEILVLEHNTFRPSAGRDVPIKDLSFSQWQQIAEEEHNAPALATLEAAFNAAASRGVGLLLDIKDGGIEKLLARLIRKVGADPRTLMLAAPSDASKVILRSLDPRLPIAHKIEPNDVESFSPKIIDTINTEGVFWPAKLITKERVARLIKKEVLVYAGPVSASQEMRRLRDECKVHGVVTEFPDVLATI
ncbi:MAG: glycerophosphodiester phosphodiesterase [Capsulimonadaceae bacterium]|nr:glycerophosphodiester phosphodiesterase [Capsulimonadaceae bacterium]